MTAQLLCQVQNCDLISTLLSSWEQNIFLQDMDYYLITHLWMITSEYIPVKFSTESTRPLQTIAHLERRNHIYEPLHTTITRNNRITLLLYYHMVAKIIKLLLLLKHVIKQDYDNYRLHSNKKWKFPFSKLKRRHQIYSFPSGHFGLNI